MEKKLIIIISLVIFGAVEVTISLLTLYFVIPQMEMLDKLLGTDFFNEMIAYTYFSMAIFIGLVQIVWGTTEYKNKKHHISIHLLYFGIIFSVLMLAAIYAILILPLEKMVSAS